MAARIRSYSNNRFGWSTYTPNGSVGTSAAPAPVPQELGWSRVHAGHWLEVVKRGAVNVKHNYFFGTTWPIPEFNLKSKEPEIAVNVLQLSHRGQLGVTLYFPKYE